MKLKEMLVGLENLKVKGDLDIEISGIENNSKNVKQGDLFVAIQGFSTDGEVSNQAIEETANIIVDNNIKSIFLETTTNPNQMKRLKEIVSSKGQDVELVNNEDDKLLSDSLAKEGNVGDSYITMYKHNIDTIVDNLK